MGAHYYLQITRETNFATSYGLTSVLTLNSSDKKRFSSNETTLTVVKSHKNNPVAS